MSEPKPKPKPWRGDPIYWSPSIVAKFYGPKAKQAAEQLCEMFTEREAKP